MKQLSETEVKHIAKLAKIALTTSEIEDYKVSLGQLMSEVEKVENIKTDGDILIAPTNNKNKWFENSEDSQKTGDLIANAPHRKGNYIEVERVLND